MNKLILISVFILLSNSIVGQYATGLSTFKMVENPCDDKYCVIDFSDKYLLALNYITENDSNLQFKKIKISERPVRTNYLEFFKFLDVETQKKVFCIDTITDGDYEELHIDFAFDNQRFQLPDFLYTSEAEMTIFFSKILDNDLFVTFTSCFPELSHNYDYGSYLVFGESLGCDDFYNLYYFKFENDEIDKVYKRVKNEKGEGKFVRVK